MRTLVAVLALGAVASAGDLKWDYEGYPRLLEAAAKARETNQRILVGMSGSPG